MAHTLIQLVCHHSCVKWVLYIFYHYSLIVIAVSRVGRPILLQFVCGLCFLMNVICHGLGASPHSAVSMTAAKRTRGIDPMVV